MNTYIPLGLCKHCRKGQARLDRNTNGHLGWYVVCTKCKHEVSRHLYPDLAIKAFGLIDHKSQTDAGRWRWRPACAR